MDETSKLATVKGVTAPMQASQWLSIQLLIDEEEMRSLVGSLGELFFFSIGRVHPKGKGHIPTEAFLSAYSEYIAALRLGELPAAAHPFFSAALSLQIDHFIAVEISDTEQIIRAVKPVVQLQPHNIGYLEKEHSFKPLVFGSNSISWGLQIAYPQIWKNPVTGAIEKIVSRDDLPNKALFRQIQNWHRKNSVATPFVCEGKLINVPMRLGRRCFSWINNHPQLREKNISVAVDRFH